MHGGYVARLSLILFIMGNWFLCLYEHVDFYFTVALKITAFCHFVRIWLDDYIKSLFNAVILE